MYGICNLSMIPLRLEPSHASEMISQVVFGEHFKVVEDYSKDWCKISLYFDGYEGYIDKQQYQGITESVFKQLSEEKDVCYTSNLIDFITDSTNNLTTIPIGSRLPFYKDQKFFINQSSFSYHGEVVFGKLLKTAIIKTAFLFLNMPYLSGGKTPFGIDSSGFTQTVYKLCGYQLSRDAKQQATQGDMLSFIEESEAGDLAFFDDNEGNIKHVGIIMDNYNIIHAYGKVRIDALDHTGIYNTDLKKHTHKLRAIKRIV